MSLNCTEMIMYNHSSPDLLPYSGSVQSPTATPELNTRPRSKAISSYTQLLAIHQIEQYHTQQWPNARLPKILGTARTQSVVPSTSRLLHRTDARCVAHTASRSKCCYSRFEGLSTSTKSSYAYNHNFPIAIPMPTAPPYPLSFA